MFKITARKSLFIILECFKKISFYASSNEKAFREKPFSSIFEPEQNLTQDKFN